MGHSVCFSCDGDKPQAEISEGKEYEMVRKVERLSIVGYNGSIN